MIETATAINRLPSHARQADFVPPADEPFFVLTSSQLSALITQAVEKAIRPLQNRISEMEDRIDRLEEENVSMRLKMASLETTEEHDISRLALDIAYDRQRLAKLEKVEPQPLQKDRGEILLALLAASGGKMLAKDARNKMHLSRSRFSELLAAMHEDIEVRPYHLNKRQNVLILK